MRAVVLEEYGGPEVLQIKEIPTPEPGVGEVRVRVMATALNRADLLQRLGRYSQPGPEPEYEIPGLEFAGVIDALGPGTWGWKVGDRVCGLLSGGGYAEYVVTHQRMLIPIPDGMSMEDAAAIPEVFMTAYDALVHQVHMKYGDIVLIHAGGSGVGTAAIQLAKTMGAGQVFVTVGSREKAEGCLKLGADRAILYREEDFAQVIQEETNGQGADVIIDFVGGPYIEGNLKAAARGGRIVVLGTLGGPRGEINLGQVLFKRLTVSGVTLRSRPIEQKIQLTQEIAKHVMPGFSRGILRPVVDRVMPFEEIADAHRYMEDNRNFGKIILRVGTE